MLDHSLLPYPSIKSTLADRAELIYVNFQPLEVVDRGSQVVENCPLIEDQTFTNLDI